MMLKTERLSIRRIVADDYDKCRCIALLFFNFKRVRKFDIVYRCACLLCFGDI